jgi:hypothetical protein
LRVIPPIQQVTFEITLTLSDSLCQMHRSRMLPTSMQEYDWYHPRIRFVRVPRSSLDIIGSFEHDIHSLVETATELSGGTLSDDPSSVLVPVHELQIPNIASKFDDVEILHPEISVQALAQSSVRCARGMRSCADTTDYVSEPSLFANYLEWPSNSLLA